MELADLQDAVKNRVALRTVNRLYPAGGPASKVFPPTYLGGVYATEDRLVERASRKPAAAAATDPAEERLVEKVRTKCVLLDSVASQANRMEEALQDALDTGGIQMPIAVIDFPPDKRSDGTEYQGRRLTSLQAPHRIADALFRECTVDGTDFRASDEGKRIFDATPSFATPLFERCPTALLFGMWDSTGPMGGLGSKFERAITSEIVGINAVFGVGTSSRIDPVIPKTEDAPIYEKDGGGWTFDEKEAKRDKAGKATKYGKKGKLSEVNLGNVTPTLREYSDNSMVTDPHTGKPAQKGHVAAAGATIDYAEQTCVISLAALRKLHFPVSPSAAWSDDRDNAARTVIAALGLAAFSLSVERGIDLRSRCVLEQRDSVRWTALGTAAKEFEVSGERSLDLLREAVGAASGVIDWNTDELRLDPTPKLRDAVIKSNCPPESSSGG